VEMLTKKTNNTIKTFILFTQIKDRCSTHYYLYISISQYLNISISLSLYLSISLSLYLSISPLNTLNAQIQPWKMWNSKTVAKFENRMSVQIIMGFLLTPFSYILLHQITT
jgi:hypothetical protein